LSSGCRCGEMRRGRDRRRIHFTAAAAAGAMQAVPVYLHVSAVGNLDPGGAHSLAVGHLAEHKKKGRVHTQIMKKFAIELLSRSAAEQLSWPPSLLAEDIFQYFPAGRAGTRRQRAIFQSWHVACNRQLLSVCWTHPTRRTTSLILTSTIRALATALVDLFASPV
jgi:hypothetical protein